MNDVAAGRGVEVIVAEAVGGERIGRGSGESRVGVERGERRAGRAGGGILAHGDDRAGERFARGAEGDVVLARALRARGGSGGQQRAEPAEKDGVSGRAAREPADERRTVARGPRPAAGESGRRCAREQISDDDGDGDGRHGFNLDDAIRPIVGYVVMDRACVWRCDADGGEGAWRGLPARVRGRSGAALGRGQDARATKSPRFSVAQASLPA